MSYILSGTHFAVDAFCYGDIANVKHYFLTHFHSDHYSGLKKGFNKMLFCSKITGKFLQNFYELRFKLNLAIVRQKLFCLKISLFH